MHLSVANREELWFSSRERLIPSQATFSAKKKGVVREDRRKLVQSKGTGTEELEVCNIKRTIMSCNL
jgi:hypothetical protein